MPLTNKMYKLASCCAVGYKCHNEADIYQINLNSTFYINHAVDQRNIQNHKMLYCKI